jgi:hypothetical protein
VPDGVPTPPDSVPTRPELATIRRDGAGRSGGQGFGPSAFATAFAAAAAHAGGVTERAFEIAGRPVLLRFAGDHLVHLAEAFAHLDIPLPDTADLRIHLWDEASTGVAAPQPPFEGRVGEPAGLRVLWQRDRFRVVLQPAQRTVNAIDEETGTAWFWCANPGRLPFWELSTPLRMVLHWWLAGRGLVLLHSAAVGFAGGGALIVGKGGSGKSTTALLSLRHRFHFAGDDYVAVEPRPGEATPYVHSIYGTGKLTAAQYPNFPELHRATINADKLDTEKAVVFAGHLENSTLVRGFPLRAILVPRLSGRPQSVTYPISSLAALTGLAPSTIFQLPGAAAAGLAAMSRVVERVPAFRIDLGTDLDGVPAAIADVLASLGVDVDAEPNQPEPTRVGAS